MDVKDFLGVTLKEGDFIAVRTGGEYGLILHQVLYVNSEGSVRALKLESYRKRATTKVTLSNLNRAVKVDPPQLIKDAFEFYIADPHDTYPRFNRDDIAAWTHGQKQNPLWK